MQPNQSFGNESNKWAMPGSNVPDPTVPATPQWNAQQGVLSSRRSSVRRISRANSLRGGIELHELGSRSSSRSDFNASLDEADDAEVDTSPLSATSDERDAAADPQSGGSGGARLSQGSKASTGSFWGKVSKNIDSVLDGDVLNDTDDQAADAGECQACINPTGTFRISWDVVSMLLVIFVTIMVPLRLAFDVARGEEVADPWFFVDTFIDVFFLVDLFLNFVTGTESTVSQGAVYAMMPGKGRTEMRLRRVAVNYLSGWFWLDLAASLPINLILIVFAADSGGTAATSRSELGDYRTIKILRGFKFFKLVRLLRLLRLSRALTRLQDFIYIRPGTKQLVKLIMMLVLAIVSVELSSES
jgi:hypothetical protein